MKKFYCLYAFLCLSVVTAQKVKATKTVQNQAITVFTTAQNSVDSMVQSGPFLFENDQQPPETQVCVFVDTKKTFQTFLGIGGAITDASAEVFAQLTKDKQTELLNAYYNKTSGIGYTMARTNIHSCDFSSGSYTYIKEGDASLSTFSIDHDRQYRLPMIKQALAVANKLTLFVSPWSPPAFMKTNNSMLKGGKLKAEFYQSWANYYAKFIKAYQKEGIPIWGLTVQNEPMATQIWESCLYTAEEERDFLKNYLGPTLQKEGLGDKKIIVWDHNRDLMFQRANTIFDDPKASKYAWGMGFHWYETWTGGDPMFDNVAKVHAAYPTKNLMFTEGCSEKFDGDASKLWGFAERYGRSMINDFNNGSVAWTDWNILLDQNGGPNHVGNFCSAPVHANTVNSELQFTPAFYYIGQFSKFIKPGAKRINSVPSRSQLLTTAFKNPNGQVVVVVMNQSNQAVDYKVFVGSKSVKISIPARAIETLIF